jgi:hypothetical protein
MGDPVVTIRLDKNLQWLSDYPTLQQQVEDQIPGMNSRSVCQQFINMLINQVNPLHLIV